MPRVNVWIPDELHAAAKAMGLNWSRTIQAAIKAEIVKRAEGPPLPGPLPEQEARWQAAADRAGLSLSEWIRAACDVAATIHHDPPGASYEGDVGRWDAPAQPAVKCSHRNRKSLGYATVCADCGEKVA